MIGEEPVGDCISCKAESAPLFMEVGVVGVKGPNKDSRSDSSATAQLFSLNGT
jgi:hypothetical protein